MSAFDIISIILLLLVLGGLAYIIHKMDVRAKNKHKMSAYNMLEGKNCNPQKIKDTIKMLRLYGGHWHKDQECHDLVNQLYDLLENIQGRQGILREKVKK